MLFEFVGYSLEHFLFSESALFSITLGAESGEFRKMMFGVKAEVLGKVALPLT